MTGYQRKITKTHADIVNEVENSMLKGKNKICYIQRSLTGANVVYKQQTHVSMMYSEREFSTCFDGKRLIINSNDSLLDTEPFNYAFEAAINRGITRNYNTPVYHKFYNPQIIPTIKSSYQLCELSLIRAFVENKAGFSGNNTDVRETFINCFDKDVNKTDVNDFIKIL
jgi:hypothetical protein